MPTVKFVTSEQNSLIKDVRRANLRNTLTEDGYCLAETFHLLEEALRSNVEIGSVIAAKPSLPAVERQLAAHPQVQLVGVPDDLFDHLTATETNQGVLTLVRPREWTADQIFAATPAVVILDGVQDPGNVGTILRAAEAFGATGALLIKGTANPYQAKALRASAGSAFRLPLIMALAPEQATQLCASHQTPLCAAMPGSGSTLWERDFGGPFAVAIGSEGQGVSEAVSNASQPVNIPTEGVESLNAAMSATIILHEAYRQRRGGRA